MSSLPNPDTLPSPKQNTVNAWIHPKHRYLNFTQFTTEPATVSAHASSMPGAVVVYPKRTEYDMYKPPPFRKRRTLDLEYELPSRAVRQENGRKRLEMMIERRKMGYNEMSLPGEERLSTVADFSSKVADRPKPKVKLSYMQKQDRRMAKKARREKEKAMKKLLEEWTEWMAKKDWWLEE